LDVKEHGKNSELQTNKAVERAKDIFFIKLPTSRSEEKSRFSTKKNCFKQACVYLVSTSPFHKKQALPDYLEKAI
jgi:hypothetical protein